VRRVSHSLAFCRLRGVETLRLRETARGPICCSSILCIATDGCGHVGRHRRTRVCACRTRRRRQWRVACATSSAASRVHSGRMTRCVCSLQALVSTRFIIRQLVHLHRRTLFIVMSHSIIGRLALVCVAIIVVLAPSATCAASASPWQDLLNVDCGGNLRFFSSHPVLRAHFNASLLTKSGIRQRQDCACGKMLLLRHWR
jgi:hypothetical protein